MPIPKAKLLQREEIMEVEKPKEEVSFSEEEKKAILLFASMHKLDEEEEWQEISRSIGRDWDEVREACRQWQLEDAEAATKPEPAGEEQIPQEVEDFVLETNELAGTKDVKNIGDLGATVEINEENIEEMNGETIALEYIEINGELVDINDLEKYVYDDSKTLANINFEEQSVSNSKKRRLHLTELDAKLVETLIHKSEEELELKREEHEKKMALYAMQLQQGKELHQEKMEILRTRLAVLEQKIHHIDHVICNRNLTKRFKSGPI